MASVGEQLRSARLAQGRELSELSAQTKIGRKFLEAIEADDRKQLPAGFFYRSWVQQYAEALSVDPPKLLAEVEQILSAESPPPLPGQRSASIRDTKVEPMLTRGRGAWMPSFLVLAFVVGSGSAVYAWYRAVGRSSAAAATASIPKAPAVEQAPALESSPVQTTPVPEPRSAPVSKPAENPLPPLAPMIGDANGEVRLELTATAPTWVSISPDGKYAFSGVLEATQVKNVAAKADALIKVGNAGGLQIRLNGKAIGPVGSNGQVRTVVINKDGYQIVGDKPATDGPQS